MVRGRQRLILEDAITEGSPSAVARREFVVGLPVAVIWEEVTSGDFGKPGRQLLVVVLNLFELGEGELLKPCLSLDFVEVGSYARAQFLVLTRSVALETGLDLDVLLRGRGRFEYRRRSSCLSNAVGQFLEQRGMLVRERQDPRAVEQARRPGAAQPPP